jgi:hypothetical protein
MNETTAVKTAPTKTKLTGIYVLLFLLLLTTGASLLVQASVWGFLPSSWESFSFTGTQEDDVTIADDYVIRSTTQISDAYLSGDTSSLSDKDQETLNMASAVLDQIITDGMTDFEKEKAVYDWMTHNLDNDSGLLTVVPTTTEDCDNPYGVLKYHNAVCVGYATTFRLFMQMMNIPCMVVHNLDAYHSWDLVQLDGNWYHTDIYSDAGIGDYSHFNMNDDLNSQDWDTSFFPAATSLNYNMAYQTAVDADSIYQIPGLLRTALDEGSPLLGIKFPESITETEAQLAYTMISDIESRCWETKGYENVYLRNAWTSCDDGYLLTVYIDNDRTPTVTVADDEAFQQMANAINGAFGDLFDEEVDPDELSENGIWFEGGVG